MCYHLFKCFLVLYTFYLVALANKDFNNENIPYVAKQTYAQNNWESLGSSQPKTLISWQAQRAMRKILEQLPCGWADLNIPPMAPYENENLNFTKFNNFTSSYTAFQPLRIDGLNNMVINKLKISLLTLSTKHLNFDFNFPNITTTGNFNLSTIVNHSDIGFHLNFTGLGQLNITLADLRIRGSFKFNLPLLLGSVKIYDLKTMLSLGSVRAHLNGILNALPITSDVNQAIEQKVMSAVNNNQILISALMEQMLVPRVNAQLKGKKLWDIIRWSMILDGSNCKAAEDIVENVENLIDASEQMFEF